MKIFEKERMKKYKEMLDKKAKKFKLTGDDLSNLYDLIYMVDDAVFDDLKLNKMDKWILDFHRRIERIVIPELNQPKRRGKRRLYCYLKGC